MLTICFILLMLWVFGKLLWFALKVSWSVTKILLVCVLLPIVLIALFVLDLFVIVIPALLIGAIVTAFFKPAF